MNQRIKELARKNADYWMNHYDRKSLADMELLHKDVEKFAELIVAECIAALFDESERLSGLSLNDDNCEAYEIRSNQCIDDIALIEKHFGVEE